MTSIFAWNTRGFNKKRKHRRVRSWIRSKKPTLGCLIETRVQHEHCFSIIQGVFPGWNYITNYDSHRLGRIWLTWSDSVDVCPLYKGPQIITVKVKSDGEEEFVLSAVYASNFLSDRQLLWSELIQIRDLFINRNTPWIVMGDFNQILNSADHSEAHYHRGEHPGMVDFQQLVSDCDLVDLNYTGQHFTWWNHREHDPIGKKLDRALINGAWMSKFPFSFADFEANGISDHSRCLVTVKPPIQSRKNHFQFFNYMAASPCFLAELNRVWTEDNSSIDISRTALYSFHRKLKKLKPFLRALNKDQYGDIGTRVNAAYLDLCNKQERALQHPDNVSFKEESEANARWIHYASIEEKILQQKSRVNWLKNGDHNTAFFHRTVQVRTARNRIKKLLSQDGNILTDPSAIKSEAIQYFKNVLAPNISAHSHTRPWRLQELITFRCPPDTAERLLAPVTEDEIIRTLHSFPKNKAPGPDGFTAEFFIAGWQAIDKDFINAVQSFFIYGFMPRGVNATKLALIPKVNSASSMKDYRPISCCNIIYKVISKLIANRLKVLMPDAIEKNQCAFVKGRLLLENTLLATELVKNYHKTNISSRGVLKLDISKAFDTINWGFITDVLKAMAIPGRFINWINGCISKASFSVSINGELEGFFQSTRGIRQGCSLSPYLFVIAMNALSLSLNAKSDAGIIRYHPNCAALKINHLCFADDLMIFMDGNATTLKETMGVLGDFETMSGLSINKAKSSLFLGGKRNDILIDQARVLGLQISQLPVRYLGLPLTTKNMEKRDYEPLIDMIRTRLMSWTSKSLSYGGRLQLIKSVIRSMTNFWCSVFRLPSQCFHTIDSLCSAFLWSGSPIVTNKSKVAWDEVCSPCSEGGLGLRNLRDISVTYSLNLIWRLISNHSSLWAAWTRHYLLRYSSFWDAKLSTHGSWIWRKLLKLKSLAITFIRHEVCSGQKTFFWLDNWTDKGRLIDDLGDAGVRKLGIPRNAKVCDVVSENSWRFKRCRDPRIVETLNHIYSLTPPVLDGGEDQVLWKHGDLNFKPSFSAKKTWFQLRIPRPSVGWANVTWFKHCIPRQAFITWLAVRDRLATGKRTSKWGHHQSCVLCGEREETREHLFFACPYSFTIWVAISGKLWNKTNPDWEFSLNSLSNFRGTNSTHTLLRLAFQAAIYYIWTERNNRRHQKKRRPVRDIIAAIQNLVHHRLCTLPGTETMITRWSELFR